MAAWATLADRAKTRVIAWLLTSRAEGSLLLMVRERRRRLHEAL